MQFDKKQYGLIIPKKTQDVVASTFRKPAIFNSDSDDESSTQNWMSAAIKKEKYGSGRSRQANVDIERTLKDDPTVYQYDEIYDEMKKKKDEAITAKKNDKKPKYMDQLLKQAKIRKREDERIKECKILKEREAEGDQFADKEVFVTTSYKKQLEERRRIDEEDKRMERLEAIGDVTKQCDLGGFYRYLYDRMTSVDASEAKDGTNTAPTITDKAEKFRSNYKNKTRNIRKLVMSDEEKDAISDEEISTKQLKLSIDGCEPENSKLEETQPVASVVESKSENLAKEVKNEAVSSGSHNEETETTSEQNLEDIVVKKEKVETERRSDIWVKRTVGEKFEAALFRYHERAANRVSAS